MKKSDYYPHTLFFNPFLYMTRTFDRVSAHLLANIPESLGLNDTDTSVASTTALFCDRANV